MSSYSVHRKKWNSSTTTMTEKGKPFAVSWDVDEFEIDDPVFHWTFIGMDESNEIVGPFDYDEKTKFLKIR